MKHFIHKIEPLLWFLFGNGMIIGSMLIPGVILGLILMPNAEALSYDRIHGFAVNPIGKVVLLVLIIFPLWKGAHHIRHVLKDLFRGTADTLIALLAYGGALAGTVCGILKVISIQ